MRSSVAQQQLSQVPALGHDLTVDEAHCVIPVVRQAVALLFGPELDASYGVCAVISTQDF